jgi:asparagine synthase (glutamine-hydrolysing)
MAGLYGVASRSPQTGLAEIAARMGAALAHVQGQTAQTASGTGWQVGAMSAASGSGARVLQLAKGGVAAVAGAPVLRAGTLAQAFEDLARRLEGPPEAIGAWFDSIDGCFAFALCNAGGRRILLANDRYGGVPIYTGRDNGTFYWASEVKAIAGEIAGDSDISRQCLQDFIAKGFVDPPLTYYRSVRQIHERTALLLDLERLETLPIDIFRPRKTTVAANVSFDAAKEELKRQLADTIAGRVALAGGGDVVVTLSGGLDSRLLLAEAARLGKVRAVTYGQPQSPEVLLAVEVARLLDVPHQVIPIDGANWLEGRDLAAWMTDGMMDLNHAHIIHVAPALAGAGVVLDGLFGDVLLGRHAITLDPRLGTDANRYLRMNRFTYFGPRIEQNFALVATPLVDADLVAFMDALPAAYTDDSRLYREASGERHGALYSTIPWHTTARPPYPYARSGRSQALGKLVRRLVQTSRWVGLPFGSHHLTMDYLGWYRMPHFRTTLERLVYGKDAMLRDFADVPALDALMSRVPSPGRAKLPTRLLTAEIWLRQAGAGRGLRWAELLA